jgi:hypothetical protein
VPSFSKGWPERGLVSNFTLVIFGSRQAIGNGPLFIVVWSISRDNSACILSDLTLIFLKRGIKPKLLYVKLQLQIFGDLNLTVKLFCKYYLLIIKVSNFNSKAWWTYG